MPRHIATAFLSLAALSFGCSSSLSVFAGDSGVDAGIDSDIDSGTSDAGSDSDTAVMTALEQHAISTLPTTLHEHEPSIAVAPNGRAVVSWSAYATDGTIVVGYRISSDHGTTWDPALLAPLASDNNEAANASVAAGSDGSLYLAWGAEKRVGSTRSHQRVYVAIARPNDMQFGVPIQVTDDAVSVGVYDRPSVAVTSAGLLNVVYTLVSPDLMAWSIVNAVSTDLGVTWTRSVIHGPGSSDSYRNQPRICPPKSGGGRIFMSWVDEDVGGIALAYSDDDGKSWSSGTAVLASLPQEASTLAFAPTDCLTHGSDVWVLYALSDVAPTGTVSPVFTHLRLAHSGDSGQTIDRHSDIADPKGGSVTMNPTIIVEGSGELDLAAYYGSAANDTSATFRWSRSLDGQAFAPSALVHSPLTLETSRAVPQWIGDYIRGTFASGDVYLVYADNAAPPHISFYRAPSP